MTLSILDLLRRPGNNSCADCGQLAPRWASFEYGVFMCTDCADIHNRLVRCCQAPQLITLNDDRFDDISVQRMESKGNIVVNQELEATVPENYRRPTHGDALVIREEWIVSKYVRREFIHRDPDGSLDNPDPNPNPYQLEHKVGYMWKRGKNKDRFNRRLFVLDGHENTLRYYNQDKNTQIPKNTIRLDSLNIVVVPNKLQRPTAMQIICHVESTSNAAKKRHIFVYTDSGKELVEWYSCVRWLKLKRLPESFRNSRPHEVCARLTHDFVKEGWLRKTGPNSSDAFRHRWFTLDVDMLSYSKNPLDAQPHCIELGAARDGYDVTMDVPDGYKRPPTGFSFTLVTPARSYCLSASTLDERREWMKWLSVVIGGAA